MQSHNKTMTNSAVAARTLFLLGPPGPPPAAPGGAPHRSRRHHLGTAPGTVRALPTRRFRTALLALSPPVVRQPRLTSAGPAQRRSSLRHSVPSAVTVPRTRAPHKPGRPDPARHTFEGIADCLAVSKTALVSMNQLCFGVLLPTREVHCGAWGTDDVVRFAVDAESLGFASVWAGDALATARLEPLTVLAAVASRTERVLLGTAAMTPALREPFITGQAIASLDLLSAGRVVLTVGAGFPDHSRAQFAAAGVDYHSRYSRLDDIVEFWRRLWRNELDPALPDVPVPFQPGGPPLWLAGATSRALERTSRTFDGWMPYPPDVRDYATGLATIRQRAESSGRDPDAITPSLYFTVRLEDDATKGRRALETYSQAFYGAPLEQVEQIQVMVAGSAEQVRQRLDDYIAAGARHIVLRLAELEPGDHLRRVAELVRPLVSPVPTHSEV